MAAKPKLNVQNFPRPPLFEKIPRHLVIRWGGQTLAETRASFWVLETTHPPSRCHRVNHVRISHRVNDILTLKSAIHSVLSAPRLRFRQIQAHSKSRQGFAM